MGVLSPVYFGGMYRTFGSPPALRPRQQEWRHLHKQRSTAKQAAGYRVLGVVGHWVVVVSPTFPGWDQVQRHRVQWSLKAAGGSMHAWLFALYGCQGTLHAAASHKQAHQPPGCLLTQTLCFSLTPCAAPVLPPQRSTALEAAAGCLGAARATLPANPPDWPTLL